MSGFVAATSGVQSIGLQDLRLNRMDFQPAMIFADVWTPAPAVFYSPWWPGISGLLGDQAADVGVLDRTRWGAYDQAAGAASRYGFVGVTRDSLGTPIGSCTVKLFRTADDLLLDTSTSDPSGNFLLNTAYYPDQHYIVAHKSSSPDVDGVTVNTLIGV